MDSRLQEFLLNLKDTLKNPDKTPVDHAKNQQRLRNEFGWSGRKIAKLYEWKEQQVSEFKGILCLHPEVQRGVGIRKLSVTEALRLKTWDLVAQRDIIRELESKGELSNKGLRKLMREKAAGDPAVGTGPNNVNDIRKFLESMLRKEQPKGLQEFVRSFLKFMKGRLTDEEMENRFRRLFKTE